MVMKHSGRPLFCAIGLLLGSTGGHAFATLTEAGNPYQTIKERNIFGLVPPVTTPVIAEKTPDPPKVYLQGITTVLDVKMALLKVQMPAHPGQPPQGEQSFVLAEGQRQGELEVIAIDETARKVKVRNFGAVMDIDFENNGIKSVAAAVPSAPPEHPKPAASMALPRPNPFALGAAALARQPPPLPVPGLGPQSAFPPAQR
jgi:hypothetical protein